MITKMAPGKFDPLETEESHKCYGNQVGCIQRDIATIIMKEFVDEKGMFHHGPISRADVRTRIGMQRLDLTTFKKLGPSSMIWKDGTSSDL